MSKAFFRFLRGELNGRYISHLYNTVNKNTNGIKDFLVNYSKLVFKSEELVSIGQQPMTRDQIEGIGKFAGVFMSYVQQFYNPANIRFPSSNIVNNVEYSNRGFYITEKDVFKFERTEDKEYTTDINTLATRLKRSSMIEDGAEVKGYIPEGVNIINEDGSINYEAILPDPPVDKAYTEWYGEKYLTFGENILISNLISTQALYESIKIMQFIRYNGANIVSLIKLIEIFCKDVVFILSIDWTTTTGYGIITYGVDEDKEVNKKYMYLGLLIRTVKLKFPQFTLSEVPILVKRDKFGKPIQIIRG